MSSAGEGIRFTPEFQRSIFGQVQESLNRSAALGFLGAMDLADQVAHGLGFAAAAQSIREAPPDTVLDMGTGGGIPGLVLRACWPSSYLVLLDSNERRTEFLFTEVAHWEGRGRTQVVRARAEEAGRSEALRENFELVTARAFGSPGVTAECGSAFVAVGGLLVVSEPPVGESRWSVEGLVGLGLLDAGPFRVEDRFGYRLLVKQTALGERYPRRVGIPTKRPLF